MRCVTDLTIAVSSLTGELTRERVALLEMRLCHEPCGTDPEGPAAQQVDAVIVTTAETHEQSTCNCSDVCVLQPTKLHRYHIQQEIMSFARMSFAYPVSRDVGLEGGSEYKRTRRGFGIQASSQPEINEAASAKKKQRRYHVYVGKLKENKLFSTTFTTLECPMCPTWFSFIAKREGRRHSAWASTTRTMKTLCTTPTNGQRGHSFVLIN